MPLRSCRRRLRSLCGTAGAACMKVFWINLLVFTTLTFAACGYHNPYTAVKKELDREVKINTLMWKNRSNELGLEARIHLAISDWLQESKHIVLASGNKDAEFTLSGEILQVNYPGNSFDTFDRATTLKAQVSVQYSFVNNKTGVTVWSESLTREGSYSVGSDAVRTQSNKQVALNTIADDLAEQIYMRVFYSLSREMKRADRKKRAN